MSAGAQEDWKRVLDSWSWHYQSFESLSVNAGNWAQVPSQEQYLPITTEPSFWYSNK